MAEQFNVNDTALGKKSATPESYDATLLFRIPRSENRIQYGIDSDTLPFSGVDVWNCYEVSFLTNNGLPVSRMMKLVYPCTSRFLVESKSLKLYLHSFNMERLGKTIAEAERQFLVVVQTDLQTLLETEISVTLFKTLQPEQTPFTDPGLKQLTELIPEQDLLTANFNHFTESPELLKGVHSAELYTYAFYSDLMRSNCRVTNQPDWGDLYVRMETHYKVDLLSVLSYIVSFRKENHFHEEVVEMIYKRLMTVYLPERLMVAAMYTRRGGIDINPIRSSCIEWIDNAFVTMESRLSKTLRQ